MIDKKKSMRKDINKLLESSDLFEVEKGIELAKQNNINIEEELYEEMYRFIYHNHSNLKKINVIPLAEKIVSLNRQEVQTFHLDKFKLGVKALLKLSNLKTLKVIFSKFGIQLSYSFLITVFELRNIKELILVNYPLKYLNDSLNNLEKLEFLDISNNKIEYFPPEISNLKNLKNIKLSGNPISMEEIQRITSILPKCEIEV